MLLADETVQEPLKILAVDDEPNVAISMRYVFSLPRYEITTADSGQSALAILAANPNWYDIIIVDQRMPNQTGVELVRAIRQRGINGHVIVVSAHLSEEIRTAYRALDVHLMFSKPFNADTLRSSVDRLAAGSAAMS